MAGPYWNSVMGVLELDAVSITPGVMSNGLVTFNISGDIVLLNLSSECITGNNATASTLQWQSNPTVGAAATISGASASLASALAGAVVALDGTALTTAPNLYASGIGLGQVARGILIPAGTISLVIGVGSTTGTWKHYIRYRPMEPGSVVTPAF